jgi:hypothetical protein
MINSTVMTTEEIIIKEVERASTGVLLGMFLIV